MRVPELSGVAEVDMVGLARGDGENDGNGDCDDGGTDKQMVTLPELVRDEGLAGSSAWRISKKLRRRRLHLVSAGVYRAGGDEGNVTLKVCPNRERRSC